jgi:hypothetical protein
VEHKYIPDNAHQVSTTCGKRYVHGKPCNVFVQDVASSLNVKLPGVAATGVADDMIRALRIHWKRLSRHEAILAAETGCFIVAGLPSNAFGPRMAIKNAEQAHLSHSRGGSMTAGTAGLIEEHGHVCVVIPGNQGSYPRVFSSSASNEGRSRGERHLAGQLFRHQDAPKVEYFTPR